MNAPSKFIARTCVRGHIHFGERCAACARGAVSTAEKLARKARESVAAGARRKRLQIERLPEGSICGLHTNTGPECKRCRAAAKALAKELAATTPWHERLHGEKMRRANHGPIPSFARGLPTHHKAVFE